MFRLSKRQSPLPTTVLLRTTLTRTIKLHYYNNKGGLDVYSIRTQALGAKSGRKLKDGQTSKVHSSSREITNKPYISLNYEKSVKTTPDLLNNKLWWLWCPHEHIRCWIEKIKNIREQNFEGEANNKPLDEEDTQRSNLNKLNSCVKYSDSLICFYCVRYL